MSDESTPPIHRRRPRYDGKYPRRFEHKYKEHAGARYADTVAKVLAAGKTPAGMHRPIMVTEILEVLTPQPGEVAVDCTLGYGGHARELWRRVQPGGRLIGLDVDPVELPKTAARLAGDGFVAHHSNFAGLPKVLVAEQLTGADVILADLGVSSMQLDDPARGFTMKADGPLDMRMNPQRGQPASALLQRTTPTKLAALLTENADEPNATSLARLLAGQSVTTTRQLAEAVRSAGGDDDTVRRVFQALRIAVNDELSALDAWLRIVPACLNPGGRVAVLTFHSGEDRRVKKAFESGKLAGSYAAIAEEVIRPSPAERRDNPRSGSAKLRWARRG